MPGGAHEEVAQLEGIAKACHVGGGDGEAKVSALHQSQSTVKFQVRQEWEISDLKLLAISPYTSPMFFLLKFRSVDKHKGVTPLVRFEHLEGTGQVIGCGDRIASKRITGIEMQL